MEGWAILGWPDLDWFPRGAPAGIRGGADSVSWSLWPMVSLWLYHPAFRHCLSNPGLSPSTHRKKYLLWVEGKAINFPLSISLGLWVQEVIPRA